MLKTGKKALGLILALAMLLSMLPVSVFAAGATAIGSQAELSKATGKESYVLTEDIVLDESWTAILFQGTLDGAGHTITLNGDRLFSSFPAGAELKNVVLTGTVNPGSCNDLGTVVGECRGTIRNVAVYTALTHNGNTWDAVGGIAGRLADGGTIARCVADVTFAKLSTTAYGAIANCPMFGKVGTMTACYGAGCDRLCSAQDWNDNGTAADPAGCTLLEEGYDKAALAEKLNAGLAEDEYSWSVNEEGVLGPWEMRGSSVKTVTVTVTAQAANTFLHPPKTELTVPADEAESFGYTDAISSEEDVSALDVLVKLHEEVFGAEGVAESLTVQGGSISKIFGEETIYCGYLVNGTQPHDDVFNGSFYNGYAVNQKAVSDGDDLEFFIYRDGSCMDMYPSIRVDGTAVSELKLYAGVPQTVTLDGYSIGWYGCNTAESIAQMTQPLTDARLGLLAEDGYTVTPLEGAAADETGAVTFQIEEPGDYTLVVYMADEDVTEGCTPVIARVFPLTVGQVISVTSADQLEMPVEGAYYRLEADLDGLGSMWCGSFFTMNATLDGNGHTIRLDGAFLWSAIGEQGVVKDLGITGTVTQGTNNNFGALAGTCAGRIENCWTTADVTRTAESSNSMGGFVGVLKSGGSIVNSFAAGNVTGKGTTGALAGTAEEGSSLTNCYWQNGSAAGVNQAEMTDCAAKTAQEFAAQNMVRLLNDHRGSGHIWAMSAAGYPWHGEEQSAEQTEELAVTFTPGNGTALEECTFSTADGMAVTLEEVGAAPSGMVGALSAEGVAHWSIDYDKYGKQIMIGEDGALRISGEGSAVIAMADADWNPVGSFVLTVTNGNPVALRLAVKDETGGAAQVIEGDSLTVEGSRQVTLIPQVQTEEDGPWLSLSANQCEISDTGNLYRVSGTFRAEKAGKNISVITVERGGVSASVTIHSTYVPVTSIRPAPNGTYVIHQRNANSVPTGTNFLDLTLADSAGTVIVEPENASYKDSWTLTSSDPSTAEYVDAFLKAVLPYKAGTVTLTATTNDPMAETQVSGTSQITLVYGNPLTQVSVEQTSFTVKEQEKLTLPLTYTGTENSGYRYVSEPKMNWTYEGDGEVEISRPENGGFVNKDDAEQYGKESCVASGTYVLRGLKAGTVTVTGTPADTTGGAKAITFTVNVTAGESEIPTDVSELLTTDLAGAKSYYEKYSAYSVGDEWAVFALTRAGVRLSDSVVEGYLTSVREKYDSNPTRGDWMKPTTLARITLALAALGENPASFGGHDFISMLCSSDKMKTGANEAIWTLIALDSKNYEVPEGAEWTREALIDTILSFETKDGGFGLLDNVTVNSDVTAMAIQALAPYRQENSKAAEAVDRAVKVLQSGLNEDCDLGSAETTAQALIAASALGLNAADPDSGFAKSVSRNLLTALDAYRVPEDGGFRHLKTDKSSNGMATYQSFMALEACRRCISGEAALFDLTDTIPADAQDHWAKDYIRAAYANHLMAGVSANSFAPDGTLTRAMMVQLLYNLEGKPKTEVADSFADVSADAWYAAAVSWAKQETVAAGVGGNRFAPEQPVSRQEMAMFLYNYAKLKKLDVSARADLGAFSDSAAVSGWAEGALVWACGEKLFSGNADGTLNPIGTATRAEAATVIVKFSRMAKAAE